MAQDALLLLEDDQALALHPDGDGLVVFDPETGQGAECCCEPTEPNPCCETVQTAAYGPIIPTSCAGGACVQCIGSWDRIDIQMTGTATRFHKNDDGSGGSVFPIYRVTYAVSHGIFFELDRVPPGDPNFPCVQRQGYSGANSRSYVETLNGNPRFDHAEAHRIDEGPLAFSEILGHDFEHNFSVRTAMAWAVWGPNQLTGFAFNSILRKPNDTGTPGPYYGHIQADTQIDLNGNLVTGKTGNQSKTLPGGATRSLKWSATNDCSGGSCHLEYHDLGPSGGPAGKRSQNDVVFDLTWTFTLRDCGTGGTFPGCAAYIAAWLAGDAAADYNGDGFVNGDDYDAFSADHPECLDVVQPSQRDAVNRLRGVNRPARRSALSALDLLR